MMASLAYSFNNMNPLRSAPEGFWVAIIDLDDPQTDKLLQELISNPASVPAGASLYEEARCALRDSRPKKKGMQMVFHCSARVDTPVDPSLPAWQQQQGTPAKVCSAFTAKYDSRLASVVLVRQVWPNRWTRDRGFENSPRG